MSDAVLSLNAVSFAWPDGTPALSNVSASFSRGLTSLIGDNGSGKSTLLRLIAGELTPTSGTISAGRVSYLRQTPGEGQSVADVIGRGATLRALARLEAGDASPEVFDAIGDDWDAPARALEILAPFGLGDTDLGRAAASLSGGERMLLALTAIRAEASADTVTLLDEPTNNLDASARERVYAMLSSWPGTLLVVSHDRALLRLVDATAELYAGELRLFGGNIDVYDELIATEQAAAMQAASSAKQEVKAAKRQRQDAEQTLAHRKRTAKKASDNMPKILAGTLAENAQKSAAGLRRTLDQRIDSAQAKLDAADARVREEERIRIELPDPGLPRSRRLLALGDLILQGPERVALQGDNGSGKSTILRTVLAAPRSQATTVTIPGALPDSTPAGHPASRPSNPTGPVGSLEGTLWSERVGYLAQQLDALDPTLSALENVQQVAPQQTPGEIRNRLARLLLRGDMVDRPISTLSGGERFRAALAQLLLAEPPAELLILDEPTNNLDLRSIEQLGQALDAYRGALLVVSHDEDFLQRIGVGQRWTLKDGELHAQF